ncbi:MAG: hypothetical protein MUF23_07365 [Pirellula sp.]|jgi:hypothetical protein|nr:hypothetical protein [Pirellula sp.]
MMLFRSKFTLSDAAETFVLVTFLGVILCFPSLMESGLEVIGRQFDRFQKFSNEVSIQLEVVANRLIR